MERQGTRIKCEIPLTLSCASQTRATLRRKLRHVPTFLFPRLALSVVFCTIAFSEVHEVRRVLVLNDFDEIASPGIALLDQGIFAALNHSRYQVEWYSENLAANLFTDETSQRRIRDGYIRKYQDRKPDLIIAVGPASLQFMAQSHDKFFTGIPIVFCGSSQDMLETFKPDSSFTGVWGVVQPEETLAAALRLQPNTKHVVVVGGVGAYDRHLEDIVKQSLRNYESGIDFIYLTDLDIPTLLRRVGQLPSNTIVLYTSIFQDAAGRHFIDANQSSPAVIDASSAPVFVLFDVNFGSGAVGGDIISFASDGNVAGHMAIRILDGEQPQNIPVVKNSDVWTFDWRALRRWGFKERDLPRGSIVLDRQPTLWESYKRYIIAGFSLIVVETVFILALLWQRARRMNAEQGLREGEERLRLATQAGKMFAYSWDAATDAIDRSGEAVEILGVQNDQAATGAAVSAMVHAEDREKLQAALAKLTVEQPNSRITYRIVRPDGKTAWLERNSRAYFDAQGKLKRVVGMIGDVTERKEAEEKLREYERAVESVEEFIVVIDREYRCLMANRGFLKRRNLTSEQVVGRFVHEFVVKEAYENVIRPKLDECFQGKIVRFELKYSYPEIGERDLFATYYPIEGNTGLDRAVCILHDITDRKRAERAFADMTRKLIEAQQQERTRIARELHDEVNQRLAMLSVGLEQLQQSPTELESRVQELRKELRHISDDVQAISHDLHSSKLEYLGAVAGMKSWCSEVADRYKIEVTFGSDFSGDLPLDVGLPLFRVLQEAVNNSIKHSGEKRIEVELRADCDEIHLIIRDSGKGFDVETSLRGKGLGLTSMSERVRLVNGTIVIESKPMGGTNIHVRVPLEQRNKAERLSA